MQMRWAILIFIMIHTLWPATLLGTVRTDRSCQFRLNGWTKVFHKAGIVVESQATQHPSLQAYRAKGILNASIEQILEVLGDTPTATEWIPDLSNMNVIAEISDVEIITHSVYAVPFPFRDREFVLHNQLRLDGERGALVAEAVSIDRPDIPLPGGHVRARMLCSQTWLQPLSADRTAVAFILKIDLQGRIPAFLAALGSRQAPFKFVKALELRAQMSNYPLRPAYRDLLRQLKKNTIKIEKSATCWLVNNPVCHNTYSIRSRSNRRGEGIFSVLEQRVFD